MTTLTKRPRGRPRVDDAARKRNNVTIRMRDELKARLEDQAAAHQRSLSEEIEVRLEQSVQAERDFGGPELLGVVRLVTGAFLRGGETASVAKWGELRPPVEWLHDPWCYGQAVQALGRVLGELCPPGRAEPPSLPVIEGQDEERRAVAEEVMRYFRDRTGSHAGNAELAEAGRLRKR